MFNKNSAWLVGGLFGAILGFVLGWWWAGRIGSLLGVSSGALVFGDLAERWVKLTE